MFWVCRKITREIIEKEQESFEGRRSQGLFKLIEKRKVEFNLKEFVRQSIKRFFTALREQQQQQKLHKQEQQLLLGPQQAVQQQPEHEQLPPKQLPMEQPEQQALLLQAQEEELQREMQHGL